MPSASREGCAVKTRVLVLVLTAVLVCPPAGARGEERDTPCVEGEEPPRAAEAGAEPKPPATPPALGELVVKAERPVSAASSFDFSARAFDLQPHDTPFQLLNDLPGVVVSQHQGGGKAPQYLVRGFDADHGTDFGVYVDGRPVNLPTHAHGQGYADTNFLIPETLDTVQLYKGPYFVQLGDFVNAGAVNFVTRDDFPKNFVLAEGGSFATQRYVLGASQQLGPVKALLATQYYFSDGPFDHPEGFTKYNLFSKFTAEPNPNGRLWLSTTVYDGTWQGSGQIPLRAVSTGQLDRFGAVDPTEGGRTDQEDVDLHYDWRPTPRDVWESQVYGFRYKLALFTDFTFFKDTGLRFIQQPDGSVVDTRDAGPPVRGADYVPGDGIEQNDQR
jgi:hypothetical protein